MKITDVKRVIGEINIFIQKQLWFDFELKEYLNNKVTIIGSIDPSTIHDLEIYFYEIFFISSPMEWKTDTSKTVLKLLSGEEAYKINSKFQVEKGYHLFKFTPEYYQNNFKCLVGAKRISYKIIN